MSVEPLELSLAQVTRPVSKWWWVGFTVCSVALLVAALIHAIPSTWDEALGFITGALCVWLIVKENIWNWPIGIVNCAIYLVLFLRSRLFADSTLQAIQIVLGFIGWYMWLHGGKRRTVLLVSRTPLYEWAILAAVTALGTWVMTGYLTSINDTAPFLDAFTTILSLVAQYQLTRKYIENWYVWILADVIYIGLYAYKNLYLTAVLYAIFLAMCIAGFIEWRAAEKREFAV